MAAPLPPIDFTTVQPEPAFWLRRLAILNSINSPIGKESFVQDIPFQRGLNIIWAKDNEDEERIVITGHSAGKTALARLIRYCLGEDARARSGATRAMKQKCSAWFVAAEIVVDGTVWAVARPLGTTLISFGLRGGTIESLLNPKTPAREYDDFLKEINRVLIDGLPSRRIPGTGQEISSKHILAWCARDQEAWFSDIWTWSSTKSESDPLEFANPKLDPLFVIRACLNVLIPDEASARKVIDDDESTLEGLEKKIADRKKEPDYWIKEQTRQLKAILNIPAQEVVELEARDLLTETLFARTSAHIADVLNPKVDRSVDLEANLEEQRKNAEVARRAEKNVKYYTGLLNLLRVAEQEGQSSPAYDAEQLKFINDNKEEECGYGSVKIKDCSHVKLILESASRPRKNISSAEIEQQRLQHALSLSTANTQLQNSAEEKKRLAKEYQKITQESATAVQQIEDLEERMKSLRQWSSIAAGKEPDTELAGFHAEAKKLRTKIAAAKIKLEEQFTSFSGAVRRLQELFQSTVHRVLCDSHRGVVRLEKNGEIAFEIGVKEAGMGGEGIDTLGVLLTDLTAVLYSIEGKGSFPRFLLHDSPRDADLALSVYHSFLRFAHSLHQRFAEGEAPFQYIVCTTTAPPKKFPKKLIKLELDANDEKKLLFKKRLFKDESLLP